MSRWDDLICILLVMFKHPTKKNSFFRGVEGITFKVLHACNETSAWNPRSLCSKGNWLPPLKEMQYDCPKWIFCLTLRTSRITSQIQAYVKIVGRKINGNFILSDIRGKEANTEMKFQMWHFMYFGYVKGRDGNSIFQNSK